MASNRPCSSRGINFEAIFGGEPLPDSQQPCWTQDSDSSDGPDVVTVTKTGKLSLKNRKRKAGSGWIAAPNKTKRARGLTQSKNMLFRQRTSDGRFSEKMVNSIDGPPVVYMPQLWSEVAGHGFFDIRQNQYLGFSTSLDTAVAYPLSCFDSAPSRKKMGIPSLDSCLHPIYEEGLGGVFDMYKWDGAEYRQVEEPDWDDIFSVGFKVVAKCQVFFATLVNYLLEMYPVVSHTTSDWIANWYVRDDLEVTLCDPLDGKYWTVQFPESKVLTPLGKEVEVEDMEEETDEHRIPFFQSVMNVFMMANTYARLAMKVMPGCEFIWGDINSVKPAPVNIKYDKLSFEEGLYDDKALPLGADGAIELAIYFAKENGYDMAEVALKASNGLFMQGCDVRSKLLQAIKEKRDMSFKWDDIDLDAEKKQQGGDISDSCLDSDSEPEPSQMFLDPAPKRLVLRVKPIVPVKQISDDEAIKHSTPIKKASRKAFLSDSDSDSDSDATIPLGPPSPLSPVVIDLTDEYEIIDLTGDD